MKVIQSANIQQVIVEDNSIVNPNGQDRLLETVKNLVVGKSNKNAEMITDIALNYIAADISHYKDVLDEEAAIECLAMYNIVADLAGRDTYVLEDFPKN